MLVDTHTHLYWNSYNQDLDQVIQRALENKVGLIINVGTDLETSKQAIEISDKLLLHGIESYATIGIHPSDSKDITDESIHQYISELEKLHRENPDKIIAIGECGLDYHHSPFDKIIQMKLYKAQVNLSKKLNLPLVIHCREAWSDIFIPELQGTIGIFHNFSGTEIEVRKAIELGYYLSFSCILTYPKNQELRDLVLKLPLDRILSETDCPFLPPQQIRGQRNEPSHIKEVVQMISGIKHISVDIVSDQILANTKALFQI